MILAVMKVMLATASRCLKHSGLQRDCDLMMAMQCYKQLSYEATQLWWDRADHIRSSMYTPYSMV